MQATGTRLNSGGCPTLGSLPHGSQKPGQVSILGKPPCSRREFSLKREGGKGRKRKRKREIRHRGSQISKKPVREADLRNWSILYCPERPFILLIVHRDQWIIQNYAVSAALTLIKTRLLLCIPSCIHKSQGVYIIFWPEGQLTFYGPFLIRVCQPKILKVLFFLKSGATLRKH